jgi:hypothetical protein
MGELRDAQDVPRLLAAVEAVLALHVPKVIEDARPPARYCSRCSSRPAWPCPEVQAITRGLEVETVHHQTAPMVASGINARLQLIRSKIRNVRTHHERRISVLAPLCGCRAGRFVVMGSSWPAAMLPGRA